MTYDLFTFGETMIRLSPPGRDRLHQAHTLSMHAAGAESNVAANLARLGKRIIWFSNLPANALGEWIAAQIRVHGVDVSYVRWLKDARQGLYFTETGTPPRPTQVIYDRVRSAASQMEPEQLPLQALSDTRWLHLTGITLALSATTAQTVELAANQATKHEIPISFDVNYRSKLWDENRAAAACESFCKLANVVFVALRDAVALFNAPASASEAAQVLQQRWGGIVVVSAGADGVCAHNGQQAYAQAAFSVEIHDRVGAGDALAAGVIDHLLDEKPLADALKFGAGLAALKLTIAGDIAAVNRAEVEVLIGQANPQDIQR